MIIQKGAGKRESEKKVIYQRLVTNTMRRSFPYPPVYREPDTDYICFTNDVQAHSLEWKIQMVENLEQADLEPYLEKYTIRRELQPEQIQMGSLFEYNAEENAVEIPKLEDLPLVKFDSEKLIPSVDEEGRYIYRKNPVYHDGKYNGRPLLLTIGVPVSNQIDTINRCLVHIKPLLDQLEAELLVIDTGSTDGTVEVCRHYGARIISYPWCDNMSAARNEGIYHARGEWYLSIDDDEWFEDVADILNFFEQGIYQNYDQASYIQRNYIDSTGTAYIDHSMMRIARITEGLHFEGRIHDSLMTEPAFNKVYALHSYAHHYGFAKDNSQRQQEKFVRNTTMLLQDVYEYPLNLRYRFQLANEYWCAAQYEVAAKLFIETISLSKEINDKVWGRNSVLLLCASLVNAGDQRLFQWAPNIESAFSLVASERAFIAFYQEAFAFKLEKASEQVLKYYNSYKSCLEQYRKAPASNKSLIYHGLAIVEQEQYIMDADAMAFCTCLYMGKDEMALEILPCISMDVVKNRHDEILAKGLTASDKVYEAICDKLTSMQWEDWSGEILDAFSLGLEEAAVYKQQLDRLPGLLNQISVSSIISWFILNYSRHYRTAKN